MAPTVQSPVTSAAALTTLVIHTQDTVLMAASEIGTLLRAAPRAVATVVRHPLRYPARAALLAVWVFAIVGDAATTWMMMNTGLFEEANPFAAHGMFSIGMEAYVIAASVLCAVMAAANVSVVRGVFATAAVATLTLVATYKAWTAVSNMLLWHSVVA